MSLCKDYFRMGSVVTSQVLPGDSFLVWLWLGPWVGWIDTDLIPGQTTGLQTIRFEADWEVSFSCLRTSKLRRSLVLFFFSEECPKWQRVPPFKSFGPCWGPFEHLICRTFLASAIFQVTLSWWQTANEKPLLVHQTTKPHHQLSHNQDPGRCGLRDDPLATNSCKSPPS